MNIGKKLNKKHLLGRDPSYGISSFKTGTQKNRKDRESNRRDKYGKRKLKEDTQH